MNKENLIDYAKTIGVKINEDEPIENIYEKVTGNSYNDYSKEQEETKKQRYRINQKYLVKLCYFSHRLGLSHIISLTKLTPYRVQTKLGYSIHTWVGLNFF